MAGIHRNRLVALAVLVGVAAVPAASAVADTVSRSAPGSGRVQASAADVIPPHEVAEAARRCRGTELLLRDRIGGGGLPLGPAGAPGRMIPLPDAQPDRFTLECQDGYIVGLDTPPVAQHHDPTARDLAAQVVEIGAEQAAAIDSIENLAPEIHVVRRFTTLFNGLQVRMSAEDAMELRKAGYLVWENGEVRATLYESVPLINADDVWLRTNGPSDGDGSSLPGTTGRGVKIAIVDTGIDYGHPDLGGCFALPIRTKESQCKVAGGYDVVNGDPDPMDDNGHGTHVAAIAAGNGVLRGVAPGASLYAYKVLKQDGSGSLADVIGGLERAVDPNRDGDLSDAADVINMSLGAYGTPDDPLSTAADNAVAAGSMVVAAAGNGSSIAATQRTITSPGTSRRAVTVGASTKGEAMTKFSSRGPVVWDGRAILKPDLVAPGESICAARHADSYPAQTCLDQLHVSLSGTSMAAPHVAGTVALLLQENPGLAPERVKSLLKSAAVPLTSEESVVASGAGKVDALAAVTLGGDAPVAVLDPVEQSGAVRGVSGTVTAAELKEWRLSYSTYLGPDNPNVYWNDIVRSSQPPSGSLLHELQARTLPDGDYVLRLTVEDTSGRRAVDYGFVGIEKLGFAQPLDLDVLRGGDVVDVESDADPSLTGDLELQYGSGWSPSDWTPVPGDGTPRFAWDTAGLPGGWYTLRLTVQHDGIIDEERIVVTLDPRLEPGWPVRVPLDTGCEPFTPPCALYTGWADPVAEDLDGDGVREILFLRFAPIPELRAYAPDGSPLWNTPVGATPGNPDDVGFTALDYLHLPLVTDLDGDGRKEILVFNTIDSRVYVFSAAGHVRGVWPVPIAAEILHLPRMVLADVNADGKDEVVLSLMAFHGSTGDRPKIVVLSTQSGAKLAEWFVTMAPRTFNSFISAGYTYAPAVGDLDGDPQLEIVAAESISSQIHAFEWDGTEIRSAGAGWPIQGGGGQEYFPMAIGDLDGDGDNEVVAGLRGGTAQTRIWAVDGDGTVLPGWPLAFSSTTAGPSLGDLDADGDLEITLPMSSQTLVLDHEGRLLQGWPAAMDGAAYYTGAVGDVDGDARPDVVVHTAKTTTGFVAAWSSQGTALPGFGMPVERSAKAPILLTEMDGNVALVASSDSDTYWISAQQIASKERLSIHLWKLPTLYVEDAMPWPMYQHDPGHTGVAERAA